MQEVFTQAALKGEKDLAALKETYYRLQDGFGFRKDPAVWGAFPLEPYSHTPYDMPAQQPGMTGQVKEDILTRMAELGIMVDGGILSFDPALLRQQEFLTKPAVFNYIGVDNNKLELPLPANSLAFTICQVPVVYMLSDKAGIVVHGKNGESRIENSLKLGEAHSKELFSRSGQINKIEVSITANHMI